MSPFEVRITRRASKDIDTLPPKLRSKLQKILTHLARFPYAGKKLVGDLEGCRSIRLTHRDRIVYRVDKDERILYVLRARSHYGA